MSTSDAPTFLWGQDLLAALDLPLLAASHGWFVDRTPQDNSEFVRCAKSPTRGEVDLLTVVEHEMGNMLGFPETNGHDVMGKYLATGERWLPTTVVSLGSSQSSPAVALLGSLANLVPDDLAAEMTQLPLNKALKLRRS